MGYSERYCHICGVSFNMGRIRTKSEPRSHAWHCARDYGNTDYSSYVDAGQTDCGRDTGCMLAYREDRVRYLEYRQTNHNGTHGNEAEQSNGGTHEDRDDENDADFEPDEKIMGKLQVDEDFNATRNASVLERLFVAARSMFTVAEQTSQDRALLGQSTKSNEGTSSDGQTDSSMDYEYDSPPETCSESGHEDMEDHMSLASDYGDGAETLYQEFRKGLNHRGPIKPVKDGEELMLPLYRQLEGNDEDTASTHGSDSSFKCDEEEGSRAWNDRRDDYRWFGKYSHYKHTLSKGDNWHDRNSIWEHIAGPGCVNEHGYQGNRITEEEMRFTNTLQCLIHKDDAGREGWDEEAPKTPNWQPEWDDEPWENEASWFLSGISDHMPSRDMDDPEVFPTRHGRQRINAETDFTYPNEYQRDPKCAMPFHPSCLEIYKRASITRCGNFDVNLLGDWWRRCSYHVPLHSRWGLFSRSEAVRRGYEQWWRHNPGDEHLAADPLYPRGVANAIASAEQRRRPTPMNEVESKEWTSLPMEIISHILEYLDTVAVAKTSLAITETCTVAKQILGKRLQVEFPYLWELRPSQPYYRWTNLTAREVKIRQKELDEREARFQSVCNVLEEEGCKEALDQLKQDWEEGCEERRMTVFGPLIRGKFPLQVPNDEIGLAKFTIALHEAQEKDDLKGLQNRERIWTDCETILDEIEEIQRGEVLSDEQLRQRAVRYGYDQ